MMAPDFVWNGSHSSSASAPVIALLRAGVDACPDYGRSCSAPGRQKSRDLPLSKVSVRRKQAPPITPFTLAPLRSVSILPLTACFYHRSCKEQFGSAYVLSTHILNIHADKLSEVKKEKHKGEAVCVAGLTF
jgi:hypothetical protein